MKAIFSILGLVIVVAIVGLVARKQLAPSSVPAVAVPGAAPAAPGAAPATPQQQVQQVKSAVEGVLQAPRPVPDEK